MIWNNHSNLSGQHAFLGASKYQWINYSDDKLIQTYDNMLSVQRGTELHALAEQCIRLRQKLQGKGTLASYVNDAIGFGMTPEVVLYFSDVCFGTADSIKFDEKKNFLRIQLLLLTWNNFKFMQHSFVLSIILSLVIFRWNLGSIKTMRFRYLNQVSNI